MDDLRLIWIDLEMTGLLVETDVIIEVACVITGGDLEPIAEYETVVWQPEEALARMTPFVREMHTGNHLLDRVRASVTSVAQAERALLALVSQHCPVHKGVLAGNSIHQDRRFLTRYMPALEGLLHYRQVDVSTLKVLFRAWYPDLARFAKDDTNHTAMADILASIDELKYYRAERMKAEG